MTDEQKNEIKDLRMQGMGYADIGRKLGIHRGTIKSWCRRNGLAISGRSAAKDNCRECGQPIVQEEKKKTRIFCCKSCREKWWKEHADQINRKAIYAFNCVYCGKNFTAYRNKNRKYCSHSCYIKDRFGGSHEDRYRISG